ncbi:D-arabinose 1-dehydrogenase-like protein [Hapsidospora chrysogenum ATCC 11550]|uniref:D-arabinose 1-dehydrogenase-like protein n=1 Tax=Hapsidospora chrysogenum (strain ATCC 11550 / CBS 779.69 / DSM 880 / IAM 14645 / JCM 23072 / IMI 49137) TaxID=857340 RepID=A0A086T6I4_HAPC1|nr:D-arabinose 1-dehydrogenase-like protein [Hapsidospora chrysogenum ATCC 11550]
MATMRPPLYSVLPPLILGTATFNTQYHPDPAHMPYESIVRRALLRHKITAFDTSPYYGPSEILLGDALETINEPRSSYLLITKAGRIAADKFDYSPAAIRASVRRSLSRLRTPYLDLVYCHDVEFVTPDEVLAAVRELRRLRDEEGLLQYVGVSGYPVEVLASLADMILRETGEPIDAVMSYSHFCVQNTRLAGPELLRRFEDAGVECVLNASMLSMGLLTSRGVDAGPQAAWHPAPPELRSACHDLRTICEAEGERLERVSIQWSLDNWARVGARFGTTAIPVRSDTGLAPRTSRLGISVMGVTSEAELDETCETWRAIIGDPNDEAEVRRRQRITSLVEDKMWPSLGRWKDYSWQSGLSQGQSPPTRTAADGDCDDDDNAAPNKLTGKL